MTQKQAETGFGFVLPQTGSCINPQLVFTAVAKDGNLRYNTLKIQEVVSIEKLYRFLKKLIVLLTAAVLLLGIGKLTNRSPETPSAVQTGPAAQTAAPVPATEPEAAAFKVPDFTVYDGEGNARSLSEFAGKPVILNFWASWCGPCKREMPDIEKAYQEYGEKIHFMLVDLSDGIRETVEAGAGYIAQQGYTFPVYFDSDLEGAAAYGVTGIPVTYFIDEEGLFVAYYQGAMSQEILQQRIDLLMED